MFFGLNDVAFLAAASAPAVPTDPNFANVSLLLHGDGANGSTTIIDSSPSPKTVTAVGNAQISTAQSKFGGASIAFDGVGDRLTIPANAGFGFGTSDYTVEMWLHINVLPLSKYTILDFRTLAIAQPHTCYITSVGRLGFFNGTADVTASTGDIGAGTWNHIAYARAFGVLKIFANGVEVYSEANTVDYQSTRPLTIGAAAGSFRAEDLNGYIDDLRITKGVARYTTNFTPPTAPFPDA